MLLRNFDNYNDVIEFDLNTNKIIPVVNFVNDNIKGVYTNLDKGILFFYVKNKCICFLYKEKEYRINDVISYLKENMYSTVKLFDGIVLSKKVNDYQVSGGFTQTDDEDFDFLLWLFNISKSKEKQNVILSAY